MKEYEVFYKCPGGHEFGHQDTELITDPTDADGIDKVFTVWPDEAVKRCPYCSADAYRELRAIS